LQATAVSPLFPRGQLLVTPGVGTARGYVSIHNARVGHTARPTVDGDYSTCV